MIAFPMGFDEMPHTEETKNLLLDIKPDNISFEEYVQHLKASQLFCVFDKNEFCGFYLESQKGSIVEVHCFVYPSKRHVSVHLMGQILEDKKKRGLTISTSVFSNFKHIAKYLKFLGFKETLIEKGCTTVNGQLVDVIYLTYEGDN